MFDGDLSFALGSHADDPGWSSQTRVISVRYQSIAFTRRLAPATVSRHPATCPHGLVSFLVSVANFRRRTRSFTSLGRPAQRTLLDVRGRGSADLESKRQGPSYFDLKSRGVSGAENGL